MPLLICVRSQQKCASVMCNGGMFSISFAALVAKMPLIYPVAPFFNNERETGDCESERWVYISLLCSCLLFLWRDFTPPGLGACPLLCFPSWSSALWIMKRCSFFFSFASGWEQLRAPHKLKLLRSHFCSPPISKANQAKLPGLQELFRSID